MLKAAKIRRCSFRLTTIQLLGPEDLIKMLNAATYTDSSLSLIPILSMSHKRWTLSFKSKFSTGTFCSRLEFIGLASTLSTWVATKFTLAKVCFDSIFTGPLRTQQTRVFVATGPSPFSPPPYLFTQQKFPNVISSDQQIYHHILIFITSVR